MCAVFVKKVMIFDKKILYLQTNCFAHYLIKLCILSFFCLKQTKIYYYK